MKCPTCKGTGEVETTVTTFGSDKVEKYSLTCHICHGKKEISKQEWKQIQAEAALWCDCGNPSGDVDFYNDGEHPNCSKHCYTCKDCGKIVQVG